jgi:RNA polymerase sigma-70 factor (ECF subfamily)
MAMAKNDHLVAALADNYRQFSSFLQRRVGNQADVEEILQSAFARSIEKSDEIRDGKSVVAWFYRLLRNAVIDHYRHRHAERHALVRELRMRTEFDNPEPAVERAICRCFIHLLPTLKHDYRVLLRRVDLEGASIAEVSSESGLTANNTRVKLHRARTTLRRRLELHCGGCAEQGCLDCGCPTLSPG